MTDYLNDSEAKRHYESGLRMAELLSARGKRPSKQRQAILHAAALIEHQAAEIERYRRKAAFWSDRAAWHRKRREAAEEKLAAATTALNQQGAESIEPLVQEP